MCNAQITSRILELSIASSYRCEVLATTLSLTSLVSGQLQWDKISYASTNPKLSNIFPVTIDRGSISISSIIQFLGGSLLKLM